MIGLVNRWMEWVSEWMGGLVVEWMKGKMGRRRE